MQVVKGNSPTVTAYPDPITRDLIVLIPHPATGKLHKIALGDIIDMAGGSMTESITFNTSGSYTIPDGKILEKILILSDTTEVLKVGNTPGASDILPDVPVAAGVPQVITLELYAKGGKTIYVSGFTHPIVIIFYKR